MQTKREQGRTLGRFKGSINACLEPRAETTRFRIAKVSGNRLLDGRQFAYGLDLFAAHCGKGEFPDQLLRFLP